jgi:hypothetical protein
LPQGNNKERESAMSMSQYEFEQLNKAKGFHWFSKDIMRFFRSRVSNFDRITGYFITSEQATGHDRRYTIRQANFETGQVETIGEFQAYADIRTAKAVIKRLRGVRL